MNVMRWAFALAMLLPLPAYADLDREIALETAKIGGEMHAISDKCIGEPDSKAVLLNSLSKLAPIRELSAHYDLGRVL